MKSMSIVLKKAKSESTCSLGCGQKGKGRAGVILDSNNQDGR